MRWIAIRLDLNAEPGIPLPVTVIPAYAIIIDVITQNLDYKNTFFHSILRRFCC